MFSVADFLDRAKARASIVSDYQLAKVIGKNHSVISGYRAGKSLPNESVIEQLCALTGSLRPLQALRTVCAWRAWRTIGTRQTLRPLDALRPLRPGTGATGRNVFSNQHVAAH